MRIEKVSSMDNYQAMAYVLLMATEWIEKVPTTEAGDMLIEDVLGGESDELKGHEKALEAIRTYTRMIAEGFNRES